MVGTIYTDSFLLITLSADVCRETSPAVIHRGYKILKFKTRPLSTLLKIHVSKPDPQPPFTKISALRNYENVKKSRHQPRTVLRRTTPDLNRPDRSFGRNYLGRSNDRQLLEIVAAVDER